MDLPADRQDAIETTLTAKHLGLEANSSRMMLFDRTSWCVKPGGVAGRPPAVIPAMARKACRPIEYGILTAPEGRPGGGAGPSGVEGDAAHRLFCCASLSAAMIL